MNTETLELIHRAVKCATIEAAAAVIGDAGFGIEHVTACGKELAYVNTGDTYSATVCSEDGGPLFVDSWGDWFEQTEAEYCEENAVVRCGYCGEFAELDADVPWYETLCGCGNLVGG